MEDWHAARDGIPQCEMMRLNAAATRAVRDRLSAEAWGKHRPENAQAPSEAANSIFASLYQVLADPQRVLPDGRVLRDLAPGSEKWKEFERHVFVNCRRWAVLESAYGPRSVLVLLACHAVGRVRRWWLRPDWPARVQEFLRRLDVPEAWEEDPDIADYIRRQPPPDAACRDALRRQLLDGPDRFSAAAASYCLRAGLGLLTPWDYGWRGYCRRDIPTARLALVVPPGVPGVTPAERDC